jgi:hypothetical protein
MEKEKARKVRNILDGIQLQENAIRGIDSSLTDFEAGLRDFEIVADQFQMVSHRVEIPKELTADILIMVKINREETKKKLEEELESL